MTEAAYFEQFIGDNPQDNPVIGSLSDTRCIRCGKKMHRVYYQDGGSVGCLYYQCVHCWGNAIGLDASLFDGVKLKS